MKVLFTKNFPKAALLSISLLFYSLTAWSQVFIVLSPEGIAGGYPIEALNTVDWGVQIPGSGMQWQGDLEFVDDTSDPTNPTLACNDTSINLGNDLTGKLAMIDRGSCNFTLKAFNAQKAGAIGVVFCNNAPPETTGMLAGIAASLINIPTILIGQNDCVTIRTIVESGGTANAIIADEFTLANDLTLNVTTHAPNAQTPIAHIQDVEVQADISNNGSALQTLVTLALDIQDGAVTSVYNENIVLASGLASGYQDSTVFGMGTYTPPGCVGDYTMNWTLSGSAPDQFPVDNGQSKQFSISASTFAKEDMPVSGIANEVGGTYDFGNIYELIVPDSAASITFALAKNAADGPLDGESLTLYLLRVNCNLSDMNCTSNFDDGQITPVGVAFYSVPAGTANYTLLTADLLDWNTFAPGPLALSAGTYLAMTSVTGNGTNNTLFTGRGTNVYYPGQLVSVVRTGGPLGGAGDGSWFLAGFGEDTPATVRLNMTSGSNATPCIITGITPPSPLDAKITLFPNPAAKEMTMDLELPAGINEAEVKLSDIMGKVISLQRINQQSTTKVFNVEGLSIGTYFITVIADNGKVLTRRFTVAR